MIIGPGISLEPSFTLETTEIARDPKFGSFNCIRACDFHAAVVLQDPFAVRFIAFPPTDQTRTYSIPVCTGHAQCFAE